MKRTSSLYVCIYICVYINICVYIDTHTHTYIYKVSKAPNKIFRRMDFSCSEYCSGEFNQFPSLLVTPRHLSFMVLFEVSLLPFREPRHWSGLQPKAFYHVILFIKNKTTDGVAFQVSHWKPELFFNCFYLKKRWWIMIRYSGKK